MVLCSCARAPDDFVLRDASPTNHPEFAAIELPEEYATFAAGIGDFDGNGFDDVLLTDPGTSDPRWTIFYNDGRSLTPREVEAENLLGKVTAVRTLDLDGDGLIDIMAAGDSSTVQLLFQRSDGTFDAHDAQSLPDNPAYVSTINFLPGGVVFFGSFEFDYEYGEYTNFDPTPNFLARLDGSRLDFFDTEDPELLDCWDEQTLVSSYTPLSHFTDSSGILGSYSCHTVSCFALAEESAGGELSALAHLPYVHHDEVEEAPMGVDYFLTDDGLLTVATNVNFFPLLFRYLDFDSGEVIPRDELFLQSYFRDDIGWAMRASDVDRNGWPDLMMSSGVIRYISPEFQVELLEFYPPGYVDVPEGRGGLVVIDGVEGVSFSYDEANKIFLYYDCDEGFCLLECPPGETSCTLVSAVFDLLRVDLDNDGCTDWIATPRHYEDGFLYDDIQLMGRTHVVMSECDSTPFVGVRIPRDLEHANVIGEVITDREEAPYFRYQTPRMFDGTSGSSGGDLLWYPQGNVEEVNLLFPDGSVRTLEDVSPGYHHVDEFVEAVDRSRGTD